MSARQPRCTDEWAIEFAYPSKTNPQGPRVWRTITVTQGTEPQANTEALRLYGTDEEAVDFLVVPAAEARS